MWPSTPIRSIRGSSSKIGEEAPRSHDTRADVPAGDGKPCSNLSILTSTKSTLGPTPVSRAPSAHCCPTNGVRRTSRKPRRDSFGASLQAAMTSSSVTSPKQLVLAHHEGGDVRSPSAACTAAVKRPELQLPRDQQRQHAFPSRPAETLATLRGADEQLSGRTPQEGYRPEDAGNLSRANVDPQDSRHRLPPSSPKIDQTSPCLSGMDDEDWLEVKSPIKSFHQKDDR